MIEKDYIMKMIQQFMEALQRIIKSIDKDNIEVAKKQIFNTYQLLGKKSDFFLSEEIEDIITYFKSKEGDYLKRVHLLGELMYLDASIEIDKNKRVKKLQKVQALLMHYNDFSKDFLFEGNNKLLVVNKDLDNIKTD